VTSNDDELVARYLERLNAAASMLPPDSRTELIDEITAHIAEARAPGRTTFGAAPPSVREILDRLGDPADIVRAAAEPGFADPTAAAPGSGYPAGRPGQGAGTLEIFAVVFLLLGGVLLAIIGWFIGGIQLAGAAAIIGWLIGVVLLCVSPMWRPADKLLGVLIWPGGLLAPAIVLLLELTVAGQPTVCRSAPVVSGVSTTGQQSGGVTPHLAAACPTGGPNWLAIAVALAVLAVAVAGPVFTSIWLLSHAGRDTAAPSPELPTLVSA